MKNQILKFATILFIGLTVVACKEAKNKTEATEAEEVAKVEEKAIKYMADAENSTLAWKGSKLTGTHNGTIKISEGYLAFENGQLNGGDFVIDMRTIKDLDIEDAEDNADLVGHLSSADFFDIENNPTSLFAITGVEEKEGKVIVKGNLTIKGIEKNIEFPATVSVDGDAVTFKSEAFTIDRTDWDIKFKSGKFFQDLAKDKMIDDNIEFQIEVKASKN